VPAASLHSRNRALADARPQELRLRVPKLADFRHRTSHYLGLREGRGGKRPRCESLGRVHAAGIFFATLRKRAFGSCPRERSVRRVPRRQLPRRHSSLSRIAVPLLRVSFVYTRRRREQSGEDGEEPTRCYSVAEQRALHRFEGKRPQASEDLKDRQHRAQSSASPTESQILVAEFGAQLSRRFRIKPCRPPGSTEGCSHGSKM